MDTVSFRFVIAAYVITWIVLLGYAWTVHRNLRRAREAFAVASGNAAGRNP